MTVTDERGPIATLGAERGWRRRVSDDRTDIYCRGTVRIRVIWAGNSTLSGASVFHADNYEAYTRELSAVRTWLTK